MTTTYIQIDDTMVQASLVTPPSERLFREAWNLNGGIIDVDMVKARDIWRDKIRVARVAVFEELDAAFMQALESGNVTSQQTIAVQKQALRDATDDPAIEAALFPDDLKLVQPAGLVIV